MNTPMVDVPSGVPLSFNYAGVSGKAAEYRATKLEYLAPQWPPTHYVHMSHPRREAVGPYRRRGPGRVDTRNRRLAKTGISHSGSPLCSGADSDTAWVWRNPCLCRLPFSSRDSLTYRRRILSRWVHLGYVHVPHCLLAYIGTTWDLHTNSSESTASS